MKLFWLTLCLFLTSCGSNVGPGPFENVPYVRVNASACASITEFETEETPATINAGADFVRANNQSLVVGEGDASIYLRGVGVTMHDLLVPDQSRAFTEGKGPLDAPSESFLDYPQPDNFLPASLVSDPYTADHIATMAQAGFNTLRLQLTYRLFEDHGSACNYKQAGWDFIDKYIGWARENNMYIILSMGVPQGGYQPSGGGGAALWTDWNNRIRLVNLWRAIADRYRNETVIAGYDIVNEPVPISGCESANNCRTPWGADQWQDLAQTIVNAIRSVDRNHLIIIEIVNSIFNADGTSPLSQFTVAEMNAFQVAVNGDGLLYDFHFYSPASYTLAYDNCPTIEECSDRTVSPPSYPSTETITNIFGLPVEFNRDYLTTEIQTLRGFGSTNNVPMHVGEWGSSVLSTHASIGGSDYISNLLCTLDSEGLHWNFFYLNFFYTDGTLSSLVQERLDVFTNYFNNSTSFCSS